jgi:hypothetical protein
MSIFFRTASEDSVYELRPHSKGTYMCYSKYGPISEWSIENAEKYFKGGTWIRIYKEKEERVARMVS